MNQQKSRSRNQAQALVEFVLALPVLLILLFGIIELGRLLQTWLAIQNAARFGARYAVTGEYNPQYCQIAAETLGYEDADIFNDSGYDCVVTRAYCESLPQAQQDDCDYDQMTTELQDWARLPSIADAARTGAAGTARDDSVTVSGNYITYLSLHDLDDLGNPSLQGYFHVTSCSNRDDDRDGNHDFNIVEQTDPDTCQMVESPFTYMDDAGGPGDRVRVTVRYVHPMIMPLVSSLWPKVSLTAWREGIVEQFRVARISGLGGQIGVAPTTTPTQTITPTPTDTPTYTLPPTSTDSPPPTNTFTPTNTPTQTPTPTPTCGSLRSNGTLLFAGDDLQLSLSNTSTNWPVTITQINTTWDELEGQPGGPWHDQVTSLPGSQYFDSYAWGGTVILDASPYEYLDSAPATWGHNLGLNITPLATNDLSLDFNLSFDTYRYYHMRDFSITLDYTVGSISCPPLTVTGRYGPVVSINPALPNPIPQPFTIQASANDPDGTIREVRFEIWNSSETQLLGEYNDPAAPYCLFGDVAGSCLLQGVGYVWPGSTNAILNGNYVVYVEARDNDAPNQYTRIRQPFTLNLPALVACNNVGTGLLGEYYGWFGISPPNLANAALLLARIDPVVNFSWGGGSPSPAVPADQFAVRWIGSLQPKYNQTETYTIYFRSDDGARLRINGQLLIDHWGDQTAATEWSGNVSLSAGCGLYPIVIEYYEDHSDALAQLRWESSSTLKETIPRPNLYPPAGPLPPTSTARPTLVPTANSTPTYANTLQPNRTPTATATNYIPPAYTVTHTATNQVIGPPTATATKTIPSNPSQTPTRTVTPTPCKTPPDLGGCR